MFCIKREVLSGKSKNKTKQKTILDIKLYLYLTAYVHFPVTPMNLWSQKKNPKLTKPYKLSWAHLLLSVLLPIPTLYLSLKFSYSNCFSQESHTCHRKLVKEKICSPGQYPVLCIEEQLLLGVWLHGTLHLLLHLLLIPNNQNDNSVYQY